MAVLSLRVLVLEHHVEHLGEVLSEMMGSSSLDTTSTDRDVKLDSCSINGTSESFVFGLAAANNRAC